MPQEQERVQSFGRRTPPPVEDGPVVLPPVVLPPVRVPLVLVVDVTSLRDAAEQIRLMVARAVADGLGQAMTGSPPAGGESRFDPGVRYVPADRFGDLAS